jgi:SAM-dependent methyltransferase
MRLAGRTRLGFYPLPLPEAERIRTFLEFPDKQCSALDPCVGDGGAFADITSGSRIVRYGVELDSGRADEAREKGIDVIHGDCFEVQCAIESFSLIYLNPPYDFEIAEQRSQRMERLFLEHVYRWLKRGGVLVMVIPGRYLRDCSQILAHQFREVVVHRLTEPESVKYRQVVVFGVRRTRSEKERVPDTEITRARMRFESLAADPQKLSPLPTEPEQRYAVPSAGESPRMAYRGLPLDQIEDLLAKSSAYRQASAILIAPQSDVSGRPLTPLHGGHVGLLCTAGMLNGVFGEGATRHIAHWQSIKLVDKTEEEEDGKTIIREKERFANELTLVFCTGEIAILK